MNNFCEFAQSRRSIRKFKDIDIPTEDIEYFIKAATMAPSGCNSQCWNFVAIKNKDIINKIAEAVCVTLDETFSGSNMVTKEYLESKKRATTFFAKAPVVIAVFMTEASYYDKTFTSFLEANGLDYESIMRFFGNYDFLTIGAAVQNLILAIHEKGYGACWMNDPIIAGKKINDILDVSEKYKLLSIIPVGVPAYTPREKKMKNFEEIYKIIE